MAASLSRARALGALELPTLARVHLEGCGKACRLCGRVFSGATWKQKLERHLLTHTGEKPFQCPKCPHRTNRKDSLKNHIEAVHNRPPMLSPIEASGASAATMP